MEEIRSLMSVHLAYSPISYLYLNYSVINFALTLTINRLKEK